jgi:hypothetical protein
MTFEGIIEKPGKSPRSIIVERLFDMPARFLRGRSGRRGIRMSDGERASKGRGRKIVPVRPI